jgi:hypothetical protein
MLCTGLLNYITTEISSSKQKKFPLVSFIDTPGLVDGAMAYPFDVEQAILWFGVFNRSPSMTKSLSHVDHVLGDHVDLIFVLFDPIGQALCKRTLTIVEQLNKSNPEKMHYYLAKADEAGSDRDRHRVLMQIVQNLCRQPEISKTNFDMPTIYLPDLAKVSKQSYENESMKFSCVRSFRRPVVQIKFMKYARPSIMPCSVAYKHH